MLTAAERPKILVQGAVAVSQGSMVSLRTPVDFPHHPPEGLSLFGPVQRKLKKKTAIFAIFVKHTLFIFRQVTVSSVSRSLLLSN